MKRASFLRYGMAACALLTAPLALIAKNYRKRRNDKGFKVEAGKDRFGEPVTLFEGDTFYTKIATRDTDGDLYIFESTRDKKGGPPLHYHFVQDEWWYVLEGEFLFQVGEERFTAKPGDSVFGPRMVPHAFAKVNDGPARLIMGFQPAGKMEEQFRKISKGAYRNISEEEKNRFREEHGLKVVGPALTFDKTNG